MKQILIAITALTMMGALNAGAFAGPNQGGTLVAHDAALLMSQTDGGASICGQGTTPATCEAVDAEVEGGSDTDAAVFKVYAAFPTWTNPRLMGITWGIHYSRPSLLLGSWGMCGDFELNGADWPGSDTGASVTWDTPQTSRLVQVYWFAGYVYGATTLELRGNPDQGGGYFGDDSIPAILDPIAGYSALGFHQPGLLVCPELTGPGACCHHDGSCSITYESGCVPPSTWQGAGTSCVPNPCPQPAGACCFSDGSCQFIQQAQCQQQGGTWQGMDTICSPNPCPQPGACCHTNGTCIVTLQSGCTSPDAWQGPNTTCTPNPCPQPGACCAANGTCTVTFESQCTGTWIGAGTTCTPNPCPQPYGACCFSDGTCQVLQQAQCLQQGGSWLGMDTVCTPNPCPQPGACCHTNGTCTVTLQSACTSPNVWQGPNTTCTPNPCPQPGACCAANGTCTVTFESQCTGTWMGAGTTCTPNPCPQPYGACCFADGSCQFLQQAQCQQQGGSWLGMSTSCSPNPCPQPGACCHADASCSVTLQSGCAGVWLGAGTSCDPNPCLDLPGACCQPDGTCTLALQPDCSGTWMGPGTVCSPNPCPQPLGACCHANGSCTMTTQAGCNGTWQGAGSVCVPNPCPGPPPGGDGERIEDAIVIPSLPYSDSGNTCGYIQDYTDCVYNAGAPDKVYAYMPAAAGAISVSLCGSGYDTALWVYAGGEGNTVGCNDDFCGLQSEIDNINVTGDVTYYIVISGYSTDCGNYLLNVTSVEPCTVACPPGAQQEGEPQCYDGYLDNYNGGCNTTGWTVLNADVSGNADVCGRSGTYIYNGGSYRDTDWYDAVGSGNLATMSCMAEFPLQIIFIYGTDCDNLLYEYTTAPMCVQASLSRSIGAGVHFWPWVGPSVFSGVPCSSEYWLHVTGLGAGVATGACCLPDGTCTITTQSQCPGTYMGDGTICTPNPCAATPVVPTSWGRLKSMYREGTR